MHSKALMRVGRRSNIAFGSTSWRTEITAWAPPEQFQDVQRRGPYRQWIHTHEFLEKDGGTLCRDRVEYAVWGGALINALFVRGDVRRIFQYRREALARLFAAKGGSSKG